MVDSHTRLKAIEPRDDDTLRIEAKAQLDAATGEVERAHGVLRDSSTKLTDVAARVRARWRARAAATR